jgi:hypothetical protein
MCAVVVGDPVAEGGTAVVGGKPVGCAEQVLHRERHATQRTLVAWAHPYGLRERALSADEANALTARSSRSIAASEASTNSRADNSPERTSAAC